MMRLYRTVGFILNRGIEQVTFPEKGQMKRAWAGSLDGEYPANVSKNERKPPGWENLQLQLGSPPVSPLGVVPDRVSSPHPVSEELRTRFNKSSTEAHNPHLIHWGMGLFCLPFLARIRLTRKVFRADIPTSSPLQHTRLMIGAVIAGDQHM